MQAWGSPFWLTVLWTLLLLHQHLVEGMLPAPRNVSILSFNLEHSLSWLSGVESLANAHFRVHSLNLRTNSWKPVTGCARLKTNQTCDLTKTFKDPLLYYRARVQAFTPTHTSNWTLSNLFYPVTDTVVGPPNISVSGCGNCLLLQLSPPTERDHQMSLHKLFYLEFTCQVRRTRDGSQFGLWVTSTEEIIIGYLEPRVEYCVTVTASSNVNPHVLPSEPHCAFTSPAAYSKLPVFLSVLCAFCLLGMLFTGVVVYTGHLLWLPKPLPKTLSSIPLVGWSLLKAYQPQQQPELLSHISVLSQGSSEWDWALKHQECIQKSGLVEEEEEDDGYGHVIFSE